MDYGTCFLQRRLEEAAEVVRWLAHDFGNILMNVQGFAELARSATDPGSAAHSYVGDIQAGSRRGREFIRLLRLFARDGAPPGIIRSLAEVCGAEATRLAAAWDADARIEIQVPSGIRALAIQPSDFVEVLGALLTNAREALPSGGLITISARDVELTSADCVQFVGAVAAGSAVEVTVSDNGVGADEVKWQALLSKPFFSSKPRHHGLGLPVVFGVLRACRGGFTLERADGGGMRVRFVVPALGPLNAIKTTAAP